MRRRSKREVPPPQSTDALVVALQRGEHARIAWLVVDAAVDAINLLGAATIDDALALFNRKEGQDGAGSAS
jgi:hypothetical protein